MAYWGIALSLLWNPHTPPPEKNLVEGAARSRKGRSVGAKTQRERDYLDALQRHVCRLRHGRPPHARRRYAKAMEQLAQRYPEDDEAQIYYALALNISAPPTDKTYANQLKGAEILEQIVKRQPHHPGVAHYLIHLYDSPALADKGLPAAKRYATIAPAAPHAQHMPSHIFTRVGYWKESIASNAESARVAGDGKERHDQTARHGLPGLRQPAVGPGQASARAVIDEMGKVTGFTETFIPGPYALAASPARYAVERGDWKPAAALRGAVRAPCPTSQAITYFARALGAARSGDTGRGRRPTSQSSPSCGTSCARPKDTYWSRAGRDPAPGGDPPGCSTPTASRRCAQGLAAAADAEDKTEKHPVTPGVLKPARELYGVMLLDNGTRRALVAFEATLKKEPNRLAATAGAAKAARS